MQTKNQKERGEPGKSFIMRETNGENLITSGRKNELAHTLRTEYSRSVVKAYGRQNDRTV